MAEPIPVGQHPYGDFTGSSAHGLGSYQFEWTPFTPAIVAWRNAERFLRSARDRLTDASTIDGFAIPGLEGDHARFVEVMKVFATDVDETATVAARIADELDRANTEYAASYAASRAEYDQLRAAVDTTLRRAGR